MLDKLNVGLVVCMFASIGTGSAGRPRGLSS